MKKNPEFWVYIVTNWKKTVLYVGITNNLNRRLIEHYTNRGKPETFAGRYYCYNLVFYERHASALEAIGREKAVKNLSREQKDSLIQEFNLAGKFFNTFICGCWPPPSTS